MPLNKHRTHTEAADRGFEAGPAWVDRRLDDARTRIHDATNGALNPRDNPDRMPPALPQQVDRNFNAPAGVAENNPQRPQYTGGQYQFARTTPAAPAHPARELFEPPPENKPFYHMPEAMRSGSLGASALSVPAGAAMGTHLAAAGAGALPTTMGALGTIALPYAGYKIGKEMGHPYLGMNMGTGAAAVTAVGTGAMSLPMAGTLGGLYLAGMAPVIGHEIGKAYGHPVTGTMVGAGVGGAGASALMYYGGAQTLANAATAVTTAAGTVGSVVSAPTVGGLAGAGILGGMTVYGLGRGAEAAYGVDAPNLMGTLARGVTAPISIPARPLEALHNYVWKQSKEQVRKRSMWTRVATGFLSPLSIIARPLESFHNAAWERPASAIAASRVKWRVLRGLAVPVTVPAGLAFHWTPKILVDMWDGLKNAFSEQKTKTVFGKAVGAIAGLPRRSFHYWFDKIENQTEAPKPETSEPTSSDTSTDEQSDEPTPPPRQAAVRQAEAPTPPAAETPAAPAATPPAPATPAPAAPANPGRTRTPAANPQANQTVVTRTPDTTTTTQTNAGTPSVTQAA